MENFNERQQELVDRTIATIGRFSDKPVSVDEYTKLGIVIQPSSLLSRVDLDNLIEEFKEEGYCLVIQGLVIFD